MKLLNIYGQYDNHTEARIVGNREGLLALKFEIEKALGTGVSAVVEGEDSDCIFASDGEGYSVIVEMHNDQWGYNAAEGKKPDPNSFWNKEESKPQYVWWEIQKAKKIKDPKAIQPPWSPDQVDNINRWQNSGLFHPFTCSNGHTLVATPQGLVCEQDPDYHQNWVWDFMLGEV